MELGIGDVHADAVSASDGIHPGGKHPFGIEIHEDIHPLGRIAIEDEIDVLQGIAPVIHQFHGFEAGRKGGGVALSHFREAHGSRGSAVLAKVHRHTFRHAVEGGVQTERGRGKLGRKLQGAVHLLGKLHAHGFGR